jgi:hypothetical protein
MGLDPKGIPDSLSDNWNKGPLLPAPAKRFQASHVNNPPGSSTPQSSDILRDDAHCGLSPDQGAWVPPVVTRLPIAAGSKDLPPA